MLLRVYDAGEYESLGLLREAIKWDFWMEEGPIEEVKAIILEVQRGGDKALYELTKRFDGIDIEGKGLRVKGEVIAKASKQVEPAFAEAVKAAIKAITGFHRHQLSESQFWDSDEGARIGQVVRPLIRVGAYIPGGAISYPSTAMMTVIPAKVAGVQEIMACVPPGRDGEISPYTLFVLGLLDVEEIYRLGGAQAVAAMALGTETITPVHKVVGPGNIYVTLAKKEVYGRVGIDMLAGPSELVMLTDENADPGYMATDMLAQLEHGSGARACLISTSDNVIEAVDEALADLVKRQGIKGPLNACAVLVEDMETGMELVDVLAPEHLTISAADATDLLSGIRNAAAVFLGDDTPVALGDYAVGVNHVLPTAGSSRYASPLGVYDFVKRSNVVFSNARANRALEPVVNALSMVEGLANHGESMRKRVH
jgi:histidinol dehydrogenase